MLMTKNEAQKLMQEGKKVQHIDWLKECDDLGKYWFYRMDYNGRIVDQDGEPIVDWDDFVVGEYNWQIYPDFDYEAHENLIAENKAMAEYLASIGFTPEQIAKIGDGGKPSLNIDELKIKDKCKRSAIGFFHSNFPEDLSTDKLWNKAKKGQLQVCEAYEYFGSDSLLKEMESLESLILSEVKHAISLIGSAK